MIARMLPSLIGLVLTSVSAVLAQTPPAQDSSGERRDGERNSQTGFYPEEGT